MGANLILPAGSAAASGGGDSTPAEDPVVRSLRFDGSAYLHRTVSSSETTWTLAFWMKRAWITPPDTNNRYVFSINDASGLYWGGAGIADGTLGYFRGGSSVTISTAKYTDPSSWYHVCLVCSSSTANLYINGELSPNMGSMSLSQNTVTSIRFANYGTSNSHKVEQYLADIYFIEGEAKSPTDFIKRGDYGNYIPKEYTGEFGTNGFHIDAQPANDSDWMVSSVDRNDGDTDFADMAKGRDVNVRGTPHHSIAVGNPFTGDDRAIYFDGSGDKIETGTTTDFNFGTGDFTIECWVNPSQSASQYEGLIASDNYGGSSGARWTVYQNYSNIQFWGFNSSGSYVTTTASSVLTVGQWQHIAVTRESGTLKIYVDGVEKQSSTSYSSYDFSDDTGLKLGNSYGSFSYQGYMYDVRVVNGTAITPPSGGPTSKLAAVTNTKLLLQPDKDDSSWDDESDNQTLTGSGDLSTVSPTASTPYDAAAKSTAIRLDSESLITETQMDFAISSSDTFTAEGWFYLPSSLPAYTPFFSTRHSGAVDGWQLSADSTASYWNFTEYSGSSATDTTVALPSTGEWFHLAIVKNSSSTDGVSVYVNGALKFTATSTSSMTSASSLTIGDYWGAGYNSYYPIDAYVYDIRFSKNEARYSGTSTSDWANFDEITAPFELNPVYIGGDQSGNKNHFTATNISSHDVMLDVPTKNYATMSPVSDYVSSGSNTFSEGNLRVDSTNAYNKIASTIAVSSGKWYAEVQGISGSADLMLGIGKQADIYSSLFTGQSGNYAYMIYCYDGRLQHNGNQGATGVGAVGDTDILQIALDLDNNKVWWGKNGTWVGTVGSSGGTTITSGEYFFLQGYRDEAQWNFGQDRSFSGTKTSGQDTSQSEFYYAPPTGFKSLNSSNLAAPTVTPTNHFDVLTYNGAYDDYMSYTGTDPQVITGTDFKPEIVWIKDRDNISSSYGSGYHGGYWFDNVMGTGYALNTDLDNSSHSGSSLASGNNGVDSFNSDGFTVDGAEEVNYMADTTYNYTPDTAERYVAWCWKLGKSGSSSTWASGNTDPDTEKYNDSAGVSIIDYYDSEYGGSAITLNHSLGAAPEFAIAFDYEGYTSGHYVWHKDLSSGNYLTLDSNSSQSSDTDYFPASPATATTFTLGTSISSGTQSHVALFTSVEGMVKVGSWVGNGSTDGPMVYCGFRPSLILAKAVNRSNSWYMWDDQRDGYNVTDAGLWADLSGAESHASTNKVDFLSTGFKLRGSGNGTNSSSNNNYIFIAWAHSPFKYANAR